MDRHIYNFYHFYQIKREKNMFHYYSHILYKINQITEINVIEYK